MSYKIHGHALMPENPDEIRFARCSCGASAKIMAFPTKTDRRAESRRWHKEHKEYVLRQTHPEYFVEDRPVYADMNEPNER